MSRCTISLPTPWPLFISLLAQSQRALLGALLGGSSGDGSQKPEVQSSARFLSACYADSLQEGLNVLVT